MKLNHSPQYVCGSVHAWFVSCSLSPLWQDTWCANNKVCKLDVFLQCKNLAENLAMSRITQHISYISQYAWALFHGLS